MLDIFPDFDSDLEYPTSATKRGHREPCWKCRGSGVWLGRGDCRGDRRCTACEGRGFKEFKTSAADRAKGRAAAAKAKERAEIERAATVAAWHAANPEISTWLKESTARGFDFAASLASALDRYGSLTPRQMETATRLASQAVARKEAYAQEKALREATAPSVDATHLETSFQTAKSNGLKWPRITLGEMVIKPAGENSKNAGALYVTASGQYLGKVVAGRFLRVRECNADQEKQVVALINDPIGTAEAYGHTTGHCCICNRELTNPESVARGIGPICADKFGW